MTTGIDVVVSAIFMLMYVFVWLSVCIIVQVLVLV